VRMGLPSGAESSSGEARWQTTSAEPPVASTSGLRAWG